MELHERLIRQRKRFPWYLLPGLFIMAAIGAVLLYQGVIVEHNILGMVIGLFFMGSAIWIFLTY